MAPYVFGGGTALVSLGMITSGLQGVSRRNWDINFSGAIPGTIDLTLAIFGIGAIIAVIGGIMYIAIVLASILTGPRLEASKLLLVAGILLVLVNTDWRISLALTTFVVLTLFVLLRLANISVGSWEEERQASAELSGFLEGRLSGTEGKVIWESYNSDVAWDGTYGSRGIVEDGTYVWVMEAKDSYNDKKYEFRGHVTVLK